MFALAVILGLCITCNGNFRADAKYQVEPHNGNPVFVEQAYSEKRAKRQNDDVATGQHTNENQSGQNTNGNQHRQQINDSQYDEHFEIKPQIAETTPMNYDVKRTNRKNKSTRITKISPYIKKKAAHGGKRVLIKKQHSNMQWHVGIYTKTTSPYMQICGGTLVTLNAVISAAHCFWVDDKVMSVDQFAVGAGKLYRPWSEAYDILSQTSDVSAIHIPPRYRGSLTNFQDDIALVKLTLTLKESPAVLPACVSFDEGLDEEQLGSRTPGTVMGWGLTQQDGRPSQVLNYVELPPLPVDECFKQAGSNFIQFITSDKICAGVAGQGLCHGDSGGGLVILDVSFPPVPYLRGVASTAPRNEHTCNTATFAAFTHVFHHRAFLLRHLPRLERDCQKRYKTARAEDKNACPRLYRRYIRCKKGRVPIGNATVPRI